MNKSKKQRNRRAVNCVVSLPVSSLSSRKNFWVEDEGHAADLLHFDLCRGVPVDEVGRDGDGQLPAELFASETFSERRKENSAMKHAEGRKPSVSKETKHTHVEH